MHLLSYYWACAPVSSLDAHVVKARFSVIFFFPKSTLLLVQFQNKPFVVRPIGKRSKGLTITVKMNSMKI